MINKTFIFFYNRIEMLFPASPLLIVAIIDAAKYGLALNNLRGVGKLTHETFVKEMDSDPHFVLFFASE